MVNWANPRPQMVLLTSSLEIQYMKQICGAVHIKARREANGDNSHIRFFSNSSLFYAKHHQFSGGNQTSTSNLYQLRSDITLMPNMFTDTFPASLHLRTHLPTGTAGLGEFQDRVVFLDRRVSAMSSSHGSSLTQYHHPTLQVSQKRWRSSLSLESAQVCYCCSVCSVCAPH